MSRIRVQQPVQHIPSFNEFQITAPALRVKLNQLGVQIPMDMLDWQYYFTDLEGWGKVLYNLVFKSNLYKKDKRDCDWYAFKAKVECEERYGLNAIAFVIGDASQKRHAFNMFYYGDGFMLWEPNEGYPFSGSAFEIGEYSYYPKMVLI